MPTRPTLAVIGTGGTIAGHGASATHTASYACSVHGIDTLLDQLPQAAGIARLRAEQLLQTGSENFGNAELVAIAARVAERLADDAIDGVVLTHGTDTIEETAYFLHLTLKSAKPVVVVGALRPPSALSSDAALNLHAAIAVAAHPASHGLGTLVVANDEIHTARDVVKQHSYKLEAFRSPYGPLGLIVDGAPRYYRRPLRPHTLDTPWSAAALPALPRVDLVHAYGELDPAWLEAAAAGARGLVFAGTGNGNVAARLVDGLRAAARRGTQVVRASRTGNGVVTRNGAQPDDAHGWLTVDDQIPQKARILLMLGLTLSEDRGRLQQLFDRY
ncbi:asparaginase [Burkholderia plantarii]|uniref:Glutaminase-asparaginase n=1 Tax=Burkholderia plantarii TaxID=41899 RepID=A0A0B6RVV5_BURPL|nr:asparaginase [Burkholderia plantarii]AJK45190.1 glutaminase-asparaginase [Burkholderia plantarii]